MYLRFKTQEKFSGTTESHFFLLKRIPLGDKRLCRGWYYVQWSSIGRVDTEQPRAQAWIHPADETGLRVKNESGERQYMVR